MFIKWLIPLEPNEEYILVQNLEKKGELPMFKTPTKLKAQKIGEARGKAESLMLVLNTFISIQQEKIEDYKKRIIPLRISNIDELLLNIMNFKTEAQLVEWIQKKEKEMKVSKAA